MLKRTPLLAILFTGIMSVLIIIIFQDSTRPFTQLQAVMLFFLSFFPSMGIAMLFDPYPAMVKKRYLKINFYIQEENPEDQVAKVIQDEKEGKN